MPMDKYLKGFTLIEFIAVLIIAAIFIVAVVPSYYAFIQSNKVVTVTNQLSAAINYARMEAIKRGVTVGVCSAAIMP